MAGNEDVVRVISPFSTWKNESLEISSANVATKLSEVSIPCRMVRIKASALNLGNIEIGGDNLSSSNSALSLDAGQAVNIHANDVSKIYVVATSGGDSINYLYIV